MYPGSVTFYDRLKEINEDYYRSVLWSSEAFKHFTQQDIKTSIGCYVNFDNEKFEIIDYNAVAGLILCISYFGNSDRIALNTKKYDPSLSEEDITNARLEATKDDLIFDTVYDQLVSSSTYKAAFQESDINNRWDITYYIHDCWDAGLCRNKDQIIECIKSWMEGERDIVAPGTKRRLAEEAKRKELASNVPQELIDVVNNLKGDPLIQQHRDGNPKAINALMGKVLKQYKADPVFVKEFLLNNLLN